MRRLMIGLALGVSLFGGTALAQSMQFDEEVIVGDVLKPEITVFISRENLTKSYNIEFEESFLNKIVESVERQPF